MKTLSPALQAHLDDGTTTLSWCWRISRADGGSFGFADHDRALTFDGTEFEPESGFAASEIRAGSDLAVDAQDASGVLSSDWITETDAAAITALIGEFIDLLSPLGLHAHRLRASTVMG